MVEVYQYRYRYRLVCGWAEVILESQISEEGQENENEEEREEDDEDDAEAEGEPAGLIRQLIRDCEIVGTYRL